MESGQAASSLHDRPLVLVCDDIDSIREIIRINLELEGFDVLLAADGHEAMSQLIDPSSRTPDVIVLDAQTPKRDGWWATAALGKKVAPTYIVDIKNGTNASALSNLLAGNIDLFNNFAPKSAIKGDFKTFFRGAPYHLGANTTWLFPNTTKKPLDDKEFRRALATSINMDQILDKAYQGLVNKASPTGLLPIWDKWVDDAIRDAEERGDDLDRAHDLCVALERGRSRREMSLTSAGAAEGSV